MWCSKSYQQQCLPRQFTLRSSLSDRAPPHEFFSTGTYAIIVYQAVAKYGSLADTAVQYGLEHQGVTLSHFGSNNRAYMCSAYFQGTGRMKCFVPTVIDL